MDSKNKKIKFKLPLKLTEDHETRSVRTESTASDDRCPDEDYSNRSTDRSEVRFDLRNTSVRSIESRISMTDDEREASWYSREAYKIIRGSAGGITIQLMEVGRKNPERFGHCYRGLEPCLAENKKIIDDELTLATHAVLREQSRQKGKGISNPSALRTAYYRKAVRSSMDRALAAAKEDAEAAAAYQGQYGTQWSPTPIS